MSERGPEPATPGPEPSTAQGWYSRMERQPSSPGADPGARPTWGSAGAGAGAPPTAPFPAAAAPRKPDRRELRDRPPGGPIGQLGPRRPRPRRSASVLWWALGALVLAAAAVVAILFGDDLAGNPSAAGDQKTKAVPTESTDPALPSLGDSTGTPTDTALPGDTAVPPGETAPPTPTPTDASSDPLGLGVPMTPPACDGTWIVILGSAVDPATYADDVSALLGADTSAKYVLTAGQCAALRQSTGTGDQIYAVYLGPYPDQQSACDVRNGIGGGVYVKRMDPTTPPEQTYTC